MNSARPIESAPRIKSLARTPAIRALLIQSFSFLAMLALARGISLALGMQITLAAAALLQGALAAASSRLCGMAPWWPAIQALFPIASIAALSLQLPPAVFLAAFMLLLGLYWSTYRTQVPFYPSGPVVWSAVARALPAERPVRLIDIGSGLGGLVMHLSKQRPESSFAGIELAPLPWLISLLRNRIAGGGARFIRGDYERLDFAAYDVVFAYLSPAAMPALWRKARAEMRAGTLLLSYEFPVPGSEPHWSVTPVEGGPALYGWRM